MEKFRNIEYRRPDFAALGESVASLAEEVKKAGSADELYGKIKALGEITGEAETMSTVAYIRSTIDSKDEFYEAEIKYINSEEPKLIPVMLQYKKAVLDSPWRAEVEKRIGNQYFRDLENEVLLQDERLVEDLVRQSDLRDEYSKLIAGCRTTYRGVECNFYGLLKFMEDPDREIRRGAFLEWARLYEAAAPELDRIYTELVKLRVGMAKKMGYASYIDYRYLERGRYDYTKKDVAAFRDQVRDVVVPVCEKLVEEQRKSIGVDKIRFYDEQFLFPDGNAEPKGSVDELVAAAQEMYRELSPETGEFFDFMVRYELYDLLSTPGKRQGGYCTALASYKAPFIFSNFNGTTADAEVLTHEAGHAFEMYTASRVQELMEYVGSVSEINEIHSMSMEFFTYPWMDKFFAEDTPKYLYSHLRGTLMTIPYLVAVDEYQHLVFEKPDMTAEERYEAWRVTEKKYLPWRDYDGNEFLEKGGFWMQKLHIFLYPFYYIEYAMSEICALQYYGRMQKDRKAAWEDYLRLCRAGGSKGYFELLEIGNLKSPFAPGTVEEAIAPAVETLKKGLGA